MASYYFSFSTGNDSTGDGSIGTPWKSMYKLQGTVLSPGDNVYLKRGDIWKLTGSATVDYPLAIASSGTAGNPITVDGYGTGNNPVVTMAFISTSAGDWADQGSNIWRFSNAYFSTYDAGSIILGAIGSETSVLQKMKSTESLAAGQFKWGSGHVDVYSVGNPIPNLSTSISVCMTYQACEILGAAYNNTKNYVTVQNIKFTHAAGTGVMIKFTDHVTIQNCTVSYVGGGDSTLGGDTTQYGEGIELNDLNTNTTITNNTVEEIFEGGISVQSNAATTIHSSINITNNVINKTATSMMYSNTHASSTTSTVKFENNICSGLGENWAYGKSWSSANWSHILVYQIAGVVTDDVYFRYNVFNYGKLITSPTVGTQASRGSNYVFVYNTTDFGDLTIDYNSYNLPTTSNQFAYTHNNTTTYATTRLGYAAWQTASGQDAHSILFPPAGEAKLRQGISIGI